MKNGRISGRMVGNEWRFSAAQMDRGVAQTLRPNAVSVILKPQVSQPQDASGPGAKELHLTWNELQYCADIRNRDESLRAFLLQEDLANPPDIRAWLAYLTNMKRILGNLNNCVGFAATLLAKEYLAARFNVTDFDAAAKAQGAPGPDIEVRSSDGKLIRCELKTTHPYQQGLGAKQKEEILKDLKKLVESSADHKLMMVIDNETFSTLCKPAYSARAHSVEIVNLLTNETYSH